MVDMKIVSSRLDFIGYELDQLLGMIDGDDDFNDISDLLEYAKDYFTKAHNKFYDIEESLGLWVT